MSILDMYLLANFYIAELLMGFVLRQEVSLIKHQEKTFYKFHVHVGLYIYINTCTDDVVKLAMPRNLADKVVMLRFIRVK